MSDIDTLFLEERRYPPQPEFAAHANASADIYDEPLPPPPASETTRAEGPWRYAESAAARAAPTGACASPFRCACARPRWPCASVPYPPGTGM